MNWQTEDIIARVKDEINDEGVFSPDQIAALLAMITGISEAMEKESGCISSGINHVRP